MSAAFRMLVISDSHGNVPLALRAAEIAADVDEIIHLGDHYDDALILEDILGRSVVKVPGNCDYEPRASRELVLTFSQKTFLITHGDRYSVKAGFDKIRRRGEEAGASAVIFGHTHSALVENGSDILLINPGCLIKGHSPSAAIITISPEGTTSVEIISIPSE